MRSLSSVSFYLQSIIYLDVGICVTIISLMILRIMKGINATSLLKYIRKWKFHSSMLCWLKACRNPECKISSVLVKLERRPAEGRFFKHDRAQWIWPSHHCVDRWIDSIFPSFWTWMTRARNNMHTVERVTIEFQIRFLASSSAFRSCLSSITSKCQNLANGISEPRCFPQGNIHAAARQTCARLRSIHSPRRKILRFAPKVR